MNIGFLPRSIRAIVVPPIKCQGIKTKLVSFIAKNILWQGSGRWIEPFVGSGVVAFNLQLQRALLCDLNPHIIKFYQDLQSSFITPRLVRHFLQKESDKLQNEGNDHYYRVRSRFNDNPNSLDFLFLSRSCFNGLMRFNSHGGFNVPFCQKPKRFQPAYITKIVNQVDAVQKLIQVKDWEFQVKSWRECLDNAKPDDFVYLDPPYIGRSTDYYNQWTIEDATTLAHETQSLPCGFAMSMWLENRYRRNSHIEDFWAECVVRTFEHFYHIGSTESLRNSMIEALLIRKGWEASADEPHTSQSHKRKTLLLPDILMESA